MICCESVCLDSFCSAERLSQHGKKQKKHCIRRLVSRLASFAGLFGRGKGSPPPAGVISQLHSLLFKPTSGLVHTSPTLLTLPLSRYPPSRRHVPFDTRHTRDHGQGRPARPDTRPLEPAAWGEEGSALLAHFRLDLRIGVLVCVRVCESSGRSC